MAANKPLIAVLCLGALAAALIPVFAHDGHSHEAPSGGGSFDLNAPRQVSPQTAKVIDLQVAEVDFGTLEEVVRLGGIVRAAPDRVQVVASAVGGTITSVAVQLADPVKAGQPLAEVASPELAKLVAEIEKARAEHERLGAELVESRAALEQTRSQLAVVEEQARIAEAELARLETGADAVNANVVSQKRVQAVQARGQVTNLGMVITQIQKELESRSRQIEASAKSIAATEQVLQLSQAAASTSSGSDLGRVRLVSPIDGIVTLREAWPGQGVTAGQPLLHVVDYSTVQIDGELPESLVDRFTSASGQAVRIRTHAGARAGEVIATGTVTAISPSVNLIKRTAHLVIDAPNSTGRLREGMYVHLSVVLRTAADTVVVPASAVLTEGPMTFVFVEEDGTYHKHDIVPGLRDDRFVEVLDGLVPGDKVVTRGAHALTQLRGIGGTEEPALDDHHGHSH
jgi:RND family efflux transporter MFP subunit